MAVGPERRAHTSCGLRSIAGRNFIISKAKIKNKSVPLHCVAIALPKRPLFLNIEKSCLQTPEIAQCSNDNFYFQLGQINLIQVLELMFKPRTTRRWIGRYVFKLTDPQKDTSG